MEFFSSNLRHIAIFGEISTPLIHYFLIHLTMKANFGVPLVGLLLTLGLHACYLPCETQSFYFGKDTIVFPTDVVTVRQTISGIQTAPRGDLLFRMKADTLLSLRYSYFSEDRFTPDGEDGYVKNAKGYEIPDTLGKGIYSYAYYMPQKDFNSTLRVISKTCTERTIKKRY